MYYLALWRYDLLPVQHTIYFIVNYNNNTAIRPAAAATPHPIASITATALGPMFELTVDVAGVLWLVTDCVVLDILVIEAELAVLDGDGVFVAYGVVGTAL